MFDAIVAINQNGTCFLVKWMKPRNNTQFTDLLTTYGYFGKKYIPGLYYANLIETEINKEDTNLKIEIGERFCLL